MALRSLMAKKNLDDAKKQLEELRAKATAFATREAELEQAILEASTDEEKQTVEAAVTEFEAEKTENDNEINSLSERVADLEKELAETEEKQNTPPADEKSEERKGKEIPTMKNLAITTTRAKKMFGPMSIEQRTAMFERDDVKQFMDEVRAAMAEQRAISNVGLTIPDVYLGMIRENIEGYSKLYRYVFVRTLKGEGRLNIMGSLPEAVWTEMCANLNELDLGFYQTEVDGYKVGGFIPVCNATLEDSDVDLAAEIITAIGQAIGLALDKAILYGVGKSKKMPLGVVTRLAQTSQPADYSATDRPWADLHTSNIKTLSADLDGVTFYKALLAAAVNAKNKYSSGTKVWCMNEATHAALKSEMLQINAAGAVVTSIDNSLPVIGGTIVELNFIPDNVIIGGYFDLYLLAERAGTKLAQSEHYRFLADQTIFKGSARYDGKPVIAEAFVAIGINGQSVSADAVSFVPDTANPDAGVGTLADLDIADVELNTDFAPATTTYTGTTTKASSIITVTPSDKFDAVAITFNGAYIPNGGKISWTAGAGNVVVVDVKDSETGTVTSYQVTVTKS
jgi:HK97 family phage major capsid protein